MPTPVFESPYPDAEAERGKFVVLDMTDTATYPLTGRGKYAILTYSIGGTGAGSVSGSPSFTVVNLASSIPNAIETYQMTLTNAVSTVTVNFPITFLEVYNRVTSGTSTAYILLNNSSYAVTTALGIPIGTNAFYTIDEVLITAFSIGVVGTSDLRIIGHYKQ